MGFNLQLPHLAQGLNGVDIYKQGLELGDLWLERKKNAELAKIERDTLDIEDSSTSFEKMIGLAKQSKRSKWLIDDINAMQSAQKQAQLANQAKMADINKTMSETNKNNATATDTMVGVGNKRLSMLRPAHEILAQTGQTAQAMKYLDYARASGAIDDDTYKAVVDEFGAWGELSPDEVKALGFAYAKGTLDPQYNWQTANNRADNYTSEQNNIRTTQATMYGHDVSRENNIRTTDTQLNVAQMNNETEIDKALLQKAIAEQKLLFEQGQVKETFTGTDGHTYAVLQNGTFEKLLDGVGKAVDSKQNPEQKHAPQIADLHGMNKTAEQSIKALERALDISEQDIYDGYFAEGRADLVGNLKFWSGGTEESRRTQEYQNIVTNQALQSLKAVFGGSPTEGERQMLLKVQASASYPPQVRKAIIQEAIQMAQHKIQSNNEQMKILGYKGGNVSSVANSFDGGSRPSVGSFFE